MGGIPGRYGHGAGRDLHAVWSAAGVHEEAIVSAIQSQATPPASIAPRAPWYVYVGAILLVGWGSLVLSAFLSLKEFGPLFWKAMIPVALELAIGLGLLLRRRWAWCSVSPHRSSSSWKADAGSSSSAASTWCWTLWSTSSSRRSSSSLACSPERQGVPSSGRDGRMSSEQADLFVDLRRTSVSGWWRNQGRFALAISARERSCHLRSSVRKGSRASFEQPADDDTDRHGADEPHLEDLDDHRALPPLGVPLLLERIDTLACEVDWEMKKARRLP